MSVLRVRLVGDDILRTVCEPVDDVGLHQQLIDHMIDTVRQSEHAVALAAPQVGSAIRLFVYVEKDARPLVFVNPEIILVIEERDMPEGCLSIPGFYPQIWRGEGVQGTALNRWGEPFEFEAEGLLAQAIQHETDHLDGILMLDLMSEEDRRELLRKLPPELHQLRKGIRKTLNPSR